MADNRQKILELDIDTKSILEKTTELRARIRALTDDQKVLKISGKELSDDYTKNAAEIKNLSAAYNTQIKAVQSLVDENGNLVSVTTALDAALNRQSATENELRASNSELLKLRKELVIGSADYEKNLTAINAKLDENNAYIKENVSAYEQQKIGIGDYKNQITEALNELNPFNGGIAGFTERANAAGGAGNLLTQSMNGVATGLMGATKAGLAFLATPIGAAMGLLAVAVGLVVGAFKFMTASMNSTEEGSQKLAKVTAAVSGIFQGFFKIVKPLGEFLGNVFVVTLEKVGEAAEKAMEMISGALRLVGFDEAADGVEKFAGAMAQGSKDAMALAEAEGQLDKAQRNARLTQLQYQKDAEKLRQMRDDDTRTLAEREAINEELGKVLQRQLKDEMAIAEIALKVANARLKAEGQSKEALDAQAAALTEIADIQERITGQESEQMASLNGLRRDAAAQAEAARSKALSDAVNKSKAELDNFLSNQGLRAKSLEEELAIAERVKDSKIKIAEQEYAASAKTEADRLNMLTAQNDAKEEFLKQQAEATVANAAREVEAYNNANKSKLESDKFITEMALEEEQRRLDAILEKNLEFQALRKEQGIINEQEYQAEIDRVQEETRLAREEAELLRKEAVAEQELLDFENMIALEEERFGITLESRMAQLNREKDEAVRIAKEKGADVAQVVALYAEKEANIRALVEAEKIGQISQAASMAKSLFKENTVAYKALAIAEATMNTYLGATKALADYTYPLGPIFAGLTIAQGLMTVGKIVGIKMAKGGAVLRGPSHDNGGIPIEAEGDEIIMTKGVYRNPRLRALASELNVAGGGISFAGGGVPYPSSAGAKAQTMQLMRSSEMDLDVMAVKIAEANRQLPPPVLAFEEFHSGNGKYVETVEGGNL